MLEHLGHEALGGDAVGLGLEAENQPMAQRGRRNRTPIVAVTSYAMVGDREKSLASGCNGYIEKPINPDTFVSEIRRFDPNTGGGPACAAS